MNIDKALYTKLAAELGIALEALQSIQHMQPKLDDSAYYLEDQNSELKDAYEEVHGEDSWYDSREGKIARSIIQDANFQYFESSEFRNFIGTLRDFKEVAGLLIRRA